MTKEAIHHFLELETTFTFAKTMANIPHSWICRKDYEDVTFLKVMSFIKDNGYSEKFYYLYQDMEFNHDFSDLDIKKGFKKPLPWIVLLIIAVVFSVLIYLDSQYFIIYSLFVPDCPKGTFIVIYLRTSFKKDVTLFI